MNAGIVTLISVGINALAGIFGPLFAKKIASQRKELKQTEETMATLSNGLKIVEQAVEENKDELSRTGAGDRIARTIRTYGPAARQLVDAARSATRELYSDSDVASDAETRQGT